MDHYAALAAEESAGSASNQPEAQAASAAEQGKKSTVPAPHHTRCKMGPSSHGAEESRFINSHLPGLQGKGMRATNSTQQRFRAGLPYSRRTSSHQPG